MGVVMLCVPKGLHADLLITSDEDDVIRRFGRGYIGNGNGCVACLAAPRIAVRDTPLPPAWACCGRCYKQVTFFVVSFYRHLFVHP